MGPEVPIYVKDRDNRLREWLLNERHYPAADFKKAFRVDRASLLLLAGLIEDDDIFSNDSNYQQTAVVFQLMIFSQIKMSKFEE